jgi:hypothetical protein
LAIPDIFIDSIEATFREIFIELGFFVESFIEVSVFKISSISPESNAPPLPSKTSLKRMARLLSPLRALTRNAR